MAMQIARLDLVHVTMPMVTPFASTHASRSNRRLFLVRVETQDGVVGWGECAAEEKVGYSSETLEISAAAVRNAIAPELGNLNDSAALGDGLRALTPAKFAAAAVYQAMLDADLRDSGLSLANILGVTAKHVHPGVVLGLQTDMKDTLDLLHGYVADGYARYKFKIEPGRDIEVIKAIRNFVGGEAVIQVDANGSYGRDDIVMLTSLDEFKMAMLEQPLPADDIDGSAELASRMRTPICLDEAMVDRPSVAAAIASSAGSIINIKPGRVGGIDEAARIHDLCSEEGVGCWIGGMLETGVGRTANIVLAALPGCTHPGDVSPSSRYYATDLTEPFVMRDGKIEVPQEPGASRAPIEDVLRHYGAINERVI